MGVKRRRCAVIARTRPGLHRPLSGCSWARAAGLEGPFRALSLGAVAGHQSSGRFRVRSHCVTCFSKQCSVPAGSSAGRHLATRYWDRS